MDLRERANATIERYSMLSGGENVLAGLSGGPDSVCLLHVLLSLRDELNITVCAVYVDHNLRPAEVPGEIDFCRELCGGLGIAFSVKPVDVRSLAGEQGLNKQEAARELRYAAFHEAAREAGAARIALGHNADDQVETFMMRLLRGSGPKGLSGIPPKRGKIIRPLIEIERRDIERFLSRENLTFVVDSSNLKAEYLRNRIRKTLMPALKGFNPNFTETVLKSIAVMQEEERYFDVIVTRTLMKLISRKTEERIELFLVPMESLDIVVLRRVLRRAIDETRGLKGISFSHIENIIRLIRNGSSGDRLYLPGDVRVIREYSLLVMTREHPVRIASYSLDPPGDVVVSGTGAVITASFEGQGDEPGDGRSSVLLDAGKMSFPLSIRSRRKGDYFYPLGFGRRKKLQDFFVDEKVPREERDSIPVVVSRGDIVWIAGYRADERFRVGHGTERFLKLIIRKGKNQ
ncbi:MAG: tRNA lysidine(34) synthetase TilS [Candidatus Sulfobium sp.]|jgi:tRNA(Ile)-lysidine synthase